MIITIDIRDVLSGPDISGNTVPPRAECDDSDFEDWTSGDETGEPLCILGSTHSFYRMKATQSDQGCFLKKDYVFKPAETKVCPPLLLVEHLIDSCSSRSDWLASLLKTLCRVKTQRMCRVALHLIAQRNATLLYLGMPHSQFVPLICTANAVVRAAL